MAEHHLPDDPRNWPDDPFQLLGVEPPVSEHDLKRAYTRLIRRFKPEHHPEQFRRVREAYEAALARAKWFGFFPALPPPAPPPSERAETFPVVEPEPETSRPAIVDPVEEAWKLAVADRQHEAYSGLIELDRVRPESPDLALRLYWLLAIQPALDPAHSRHNWLLAALTRSRLSGPAIELYRRELEASPETGLFQPYTRLLEMDASGGNLLWIARQRLGVAGLKRSWAAIDVDLRILSNRAAQLDEVAWLSFLVGVMAHVGFDQPAPVYERCSDLLVGLRHLELRESWAFDQVEEQQQMARVWRGAAVAPVPVREVVRDAWVAPAEGWKKAMAQAAAWAANDPVSALRQFDHAACVPECQQVLATFQRLLDDCQPTRTSAYPPGVIRGLVREFLLKNGLGNYVGMRPDLLRLLIHDAIDPQELVQACVVDSALRPRAMIEHIRTDSVLRLVWRTAHARH
jgi:hypothetical protein